MKEVIKFNLKGPTAVIRKPESNSVYFTYNNVHKIMILGIIGAIIGENGYNFNQLKNELDIKSKNMPKELPEFYNNLKDLKIAVVPNSNLGVFSKKIQQFNNSVGYASKEEGNNLIVTEQYLENPSWDIYILSNETDEYLKIKEYLLNHKCEYIPYIGKNEHFADICDVQLLEAEKCNNICGNLDSIFTDNKYEFVNDFLEDILYSDKKTKFEYKEVMPTKLDADIGYINFKEFLFTNKKVEIKNANNIYLVENKNIYFF